MFFKLEIESEHNFFRRDIQCSWNTVGGGSGFVQATKFFGSSLYIGGDFASYAGVNGTSAIVRYDGSNFYSVGGGITGGAPYVTMFLVNGTDLYVGGSYNGVAGGSISTSAISRWDGSNWYTLGTSPFIIAEVTGMVVDGQYLWISAWRGGSFLRKFDSLSSTWTDYSSFNRRPLGLALIGGYLYVGGLFTTVGGISASRAAKYNISSGVWSALGSGLDDEVYVMGRNGTDLYFSGAFLNADGVSATRVAKYDTISGTWSALGSGLNDVAWVFGSDGTNVFVGGQFSTAGGVTVNSVAKWDGSSFSALSGSAIGTNGDVFSLNYENSKLYVGGYFTSAGGIDVNGLATYECVNNPNPTPVPTPAIIPSPPPTPKPTPAGRR